MREFFVDPSDTREELLAATYRALQRHGYRALSLQTIGEAFEKSPSLIYHHYDSKDELVRDTLDAMLDQLEASVEAAGDDPVATVAAFVDMVAAAPDSDDFQFLRAMTEIRGQAPHDPAFREQFARADRVLETRLRRAIAAGADEGAFAVDDPARAARCVYTMLTGAMVRRTAAVEGPSRATLRADTAALLGRPSL